MFRMTWQFVYKTGHKLLQSNFSMEGDDGEWNCGFNPKCPYK